MKKRKRNTPGAQCPTRPKPRRPPQPGKGIPLHPISCCYKQPEPELLPTIEKQKVYCSSISDNLKQYSLIATASSIKFELEEQDVKINVE